MLLQLSIEIMMGMSISLILAAVGFAIYLHSLQSYNLYHASMLQFVNRSGYYAGSLYNYCRCG